jgi:predicted dehydrogenase
VRFANGAALQFQVAWASHLAEQFVLEIYGTDGAASIGNKEGVELYTTLNGQQAKIQVELPNDPLGSYPRMVESFLRYLDGDTTAEIVTPMQALTSVKIIDGIMRSAVSGHEVSLTEETTGTPLADTLQKA